MRNINWLKTTLVAALAAVPFCTVWVAMNTKQPEQRSSLNVKAGGTEISIEDLRSRADAGDAESQEALGGRLVDGTGVRQDFIEAAKWFSRAAQQNHPNAQLNLAMLYEAGRGVPLDEAEAARWFRRAAEQGVADAQYQLALLHALGRGVRKDKEESVVWFRRAADLGLAAAQFNLAQRYEAGQGVKADLVDSYYWYQRSATGGLADGQKACQRLEQILSPDQIALARQRTSHPMSTERKTN
jgi:TPR repeat protein